MAAQLLKSVTKPVSNTIFSQGSGSKSEGEGDKKKKGGGGDSNKNIQLKEFFWDQFITYLATAIGLLTILDVSLQFFRSNGGLQCYIPMSILQDEVTRDNAAYVNTYCVSSLTWGEYYSVFILIQGILVVAPHYLWTSVFSGRFDFFVDLVQQLDRLRDSDTGDYRPKNIEIVKKLEQEFPENWKWSGIFCLYIAKLSVQLFVIVVSIVINIVVFPESDFAFSFPCPRNFNESAPPPFGWLLPSAVSCSYPSFRVLSKILIVDYILLLLALATAIFGLLWCVKRHSSSLGYKLVAEFAFSSCLPPEEYVRESVWRKPKTFFTPRISCDLDFLVMRLFRADSGHGRVFKDIQVTKEIKSLVTQDHVLLHLYNDAIHDEKRSTAVVEAFRETLCKKCVGHLQVANKIKELMGEERLGNMTFQPGSGLRIFLYEFFQYTPFNDLAYDIAFGTVGCQLILARGFKKVVSVNFHPFYRNPTEVVKKEEFQVNYSSNTLQDDIFAQKRQNLKLSDEAIDGDLHKSRDPKTKTLKGKREINFIVVGPFLKESTRGTVNLHIERLNTSKYFGKKAVLLALRPTQIAGKDVSKHFCKYEPAKKLFTRVQPDEYPVPVLVTCGDVDCLFEFIMYTFGVNPSSSIVQLEKSPQSLRSNSGLRNHPPVTSPHQTASDTFSGRCPVSDSANLIVLSPDVKDNRAKKQQKRTRSTVSSPPESGVFDFVTCV